MSINVVIGGNSTAAVAAINDVTKSLNNVPAAASKTEQAVSKIPAALNNVSSSAKTVAPAVFEITNAFQKISGLSFDDKLKQALDRVNTSIDQNVADALSAGKSFEKMGNDALVSAQKLSVLQKQVAGFGGGVKTFTTSFATIPPAVNNANNALLKTPPASNAATQSMVNLGRVVQDAPFGFIGIANNLNPLIEGFQRTRAAAGSTGGAFKALLGSLKGAGGIGLAVSVISSGLVLFGDRIFGTGKKAKEAAKELDELGKSIAGQAVKLTSLVGLVQNVNSSYGDKQKAIRAINQEYGDYIKNLGLEQVNLNNISAAYDKIIDSLIRQAVVKGIQDEISKSIEETAKQLVTLGIEQQKYTDTEKKKIEQQNKGVDATKKQVDTLGLAIEGFNRYNQVARDGQLVQRELTSEYQNSLVAGKDYEALTKSLKDKLKEQLAPVLNLASSYGDLDIKLRDLKKTTEALSAPGQLGTGITDALSTQLKLLKPIQAQPLVDSITNSIKTADFSKATETVNLQLFNSFNDAFEKIGAEIPDIDVTISPVINEQRLNKALKAAQQARELAEQFAQVLSSGFTQFFDTIIEGGNAFQAFGDLVKSIMQQIIQQLIQATIQSLILSTITGGGGLASRAANFNFRPRQAGGPVSGGSPFLVGETGPELFVPSNTGRIIPNNSLGSITGQASQLIRVLVTGEVSGRSLRLVESRQEKYERRNA